MKFSSKQLVAALDAISGVNAVVEIDPKKTEVDPKELSPIGEDHAFYTYFIPGAIFQAKDGSNWQVEAIGTGTGMNMARIRNIWYPREEATVYVDAIRKSIDMWIYPQIQVVPTLVVADKK